MIVAMSAVRKDAVRARLDNPCADLRLNRVYTVDLPLAHARAV
jgi:hypothetical protein